MLRFAPSPTGDMHIGDLRVALFNYILSQQRDEGLVVRIEDIDTEKNIEGKDQEILDLLALFGIEYSHVIYQSQNIRFHSAMALQLMHEKKAFSCFCSSEWLEKKNQESKKSKKAYKYDDACRNLPAELVIDNNNPFTIRIGRPDKDILVKDLKKGTIFFKPETIDSFIIMDQYKVPTHNFASAIDDMLSNISLVIRSEDHMSNSPKQDHIRKTLNYEDIVEYMHIPVILNDSGEKMSSTDNAFSVKWLLEEGYLPNAISNYLISIGNKVPCEIFIIKDTMEWFNLKNLSESPSSFNIDLLKHINTEHLKNLDSLELSRYVGFADANIGKLAKIYLEEASTTKELKSKIEPIFKVKDIPKEFLESANIMAKTIKSAPYFEEYDDFKNYIMHKSGLKSEDFSKTLRYLLTGAKNGPDISKIYKYLKNYIGEIVK